MYDFTVVKWPNLYKNVIIFLKFRGGSTLVEQLNCNPRLEGSTPAPEVENRKK